LAFIGKHDINKKNNKFNKPNPKSLFNRVGKLKTSNMTKNKSKPIALLGAAMLMGTMSYAQNISTQSVNSGGTKMTQANGSLSFTVGELVVLSQTDSDGNTIGGGFTAGATLTTVSIQETDVAVLDVKVYPNPTTELVNIQINHSTLDQVVVTITDLQGKEVYIGKYAGISNVIGINTALYATGTYVLSLKNLTNQVLGTYKIIKH
tara:strand:- start:480 stop:1097 length:618 start_codon:yes stop_codon:yes gene_type:complete